MYYWVGLNIGDVSEQAGGDLLGQGVNVAARLEALAEPGGGWHWSNGEPSSFINWTSHGPESWKGNQHLANFAYPRFSKPFPKWGDTPSIHASIVIEVPE